MLGSPVRFLLLWLCLLVALGSCSADHGAAGGVTTPREEHQGRAAMPATLRMAFLRTQQKAAGHDFASDASGTLRAHAGGRGATAEVLATARGVRFSRAGDDGWALGVETTRVGREG